MQVHIDASTDTYSKNFEIGIASRIIATNFDAHCSQLR